MEASWEDLRLFLAAWEAGTLTAAARRLGIGQATMSRRLAGLEAQLGHALFDRSRDGLVPTDAAHALHPHAVEMADAVRRAGAALQDLEDHPRGVVRIACPPGIAVDLLPGLIPLLRRRFPDVRLDIQSANLTVDLTRHVADIALRDRPPTSGDLVFRRLGDVRLGIYASPAYVASLGPDPAPGELEWIGWSEEMAHIGMARAIDGWRGDRPPALLTNSFLAMRAAAQAGVGCVLFPSAQAAVAGLVPVPVDVGELPVGPWYMVIPRALRHVPRVAAVAGFLGDVLDRVGSLDDESLRRWPPADLG
ncbi:MAG: LysR family transcriptional regulator [Alphaproteobacteria bacterium]|nr:LysR family transcriptional regulator [Alphaproteobacteria bacterium]